MREACHVSVPQCPAGSSASSISTLPVDAGSMNAMRAPPWPIRGVSSRSFTPFAFSSASAPSMSSTSKQMWNRPVPFSSIHLVTPDSGAWLSNSSR